MKKYIYFLILLIFISCFYSSNITGKVVKIVDGDTFYILNNEKKLFKIRIADIDAPEKKQDFGKEASDFIKSKIFGKYVNIVKKKNKSKDRYGRILADVFYDKKKNIGEELLDQGLAWVWHFSKNDTYKLHQNIAKKAKKGIWSKNNQIDPYQWRNNYKMRNNM